MIEHNKNKRLKIGDIVKPSPSFTFHRNRRNQKGIIIEEVKFRGEDYQEGVFRIYWFKDKIKTTTRERFLLPMNKQ